MFARAIGDSNPAFTDAESTEARDIGGVVAPPTFTMAALQFDQRSELRPVFGRPWRGSGREPTGLSQRSVATLHAEQSFEYHKAVRPGMVLRAERHDGASWEKDGRRGGRLHFQEIVTEYKDESGEL